MIEFGKELTKIYRTMEFAKFSIIYEISTMRACFNIHNLETIYGAFLQILTLDVVQRSLSSFNQCLADEDTRPWQVSRKFWILSRKYKCSFSSSRLLLNAFLITEQCVCATHGRWWKCSSSTGFIIFFALSKLKYRIAKHCC